MSFSTVCWTFLLGCPTQHIQNWHQNCQSHEFAFLSTITFLPLRLKIFDDTFSFICLAMNPVNFSFQVFLRSAPLFPFSWQLSQSKYSLPQLKLMKQAFIFVSYCTMQMTHHFLINLAQQPI